MKSVEIKVKGRVQGVFFRANVTAKANEIGLKGYAKNLDDGEVEIIAQGTEEQIEELIKFIQNNPGHSQVEEINVKDYKHKIDWKGFVIKY